MHFLLYILYKFCNDWNIKYILLLKALPFLIQKY